MASFARRVIVALLLVSLIVLVGDKLLRTHSFIAVETPRDEAHPRMDVAHSNPDEDEAADKSIIDIQQNSTITERPVAPPKVEKEQRTEAPKVQEDPRPETPKPKPAYVSDDVSGPKVSRERILDAAGVSKKVAEVREGLFAHPKFEHSKLKLLMLDHPKKWENNTLMQKLKTGLRIMESGKNDSCLIRIMQFCGTFCEHVQGGIVSEWTDYPCSSLTVCRVQFKISVSLRDFLTSDVVIFMPGLFKWQTLTQKRPQGQLWVFHSKESPGHWASYSPPPELGNPFDISITYMTDSDIVLPYQYYAPTVKNLNISAIPKRSKLMSWMATNCYKTSWNRIGLVQKLQKYLPIDTYGRCGNLVCLRNDSACADLPSRYKFHLALENSQCSEYITEKFWSSGLMQGTVPIVYGAPKEDYVRLAPPHSFIHLDDFSSIEEFVEYIKMLDKNDTLYNEYFKWRDMGSVLKGITLLSTRKLTNSHVCYIIAVLLDRSYNRSKYSWQRDNPVFHDWWNGMCRDKHSVLGQDISFAPQSLERN